MSFKKTLITILVCIHGVIVADCTEWTIPPLWVLKWFIWSDFLHLFEKALFWGPRYLYLFCCLTFVIILKRSPRPMPPMSTSTPASTTNSEFGSTAFPIFPTEAPNPNRSQSATIGLYACVGVISILAVTMILVIFLRRRRFRQRRRLGENIEEGFGSMQSLLERESNLWTDHIERVINVSIHGRSLCFTS